MVCQQARRGHAPGTPEIVCAAELDSIVGLKLSVSFRGPRSPSNIPSRLTNARTTMRRIARFSRSLSACNPVAIFPWSVTERLGR